MKRRDFIQIACATGVGILAGCTSMSNSKTAHLASAELVIVNKHQQLKVAKASLNNNDIAAVAYQDKTIGLIKLAENSYTASILICPHQGCSVEYSNNEEKHYICPYHGAKFTQEGIVTKGPATANLTTLETTSDQNYVYIQLP
ncbi:MAG: Rieske (2Fe-2S) protein [Thalassotalea sp.]|nr:Rieske (2Fe-2S) protein [Thalassotalea sp.]